MGLTPAEPCEPDLHAVAETTVKTHVRNILRKLGARNRTEAAARLNTQLGCVRLATGSVAGLPGVDGDTRLVELLRAGDEQAFAALIDRYHSVMLRLATVYVRDRAVAEDVVQDTWLGCCEGSIALRRARRSKTGSSTS